MTADAADLLASTVIDVRRGPFALAGWPLGQRTEVLAALAHPLTSRVLEHAYLVSDEKELTLFATEEAVDTLPEPERQERGWCLLTLDTVMEWDVVGVLAAVSGALAEAGIPLGAVAAYSRDHLLVKTEQLDQAVTVLRTLCADVRER